MKNEYTKWIHAELIKYKNQDEAMKMKKYMRDQFEFFGLRAPQRKELVRTLIKEHGKPPEDRFNDIIYELWALPERAYQVIALELLDRKMKQFKEEDILLLEYLISHKSWWDTVDWIASKHAGHYFQQYPHQTKTTTGRWIGSENIWLQRSALLFQLKYKDQTDENLLYDYITRCLESEEFFIKKSIGWVLREYSKTNPQSVVNFVERHDLSKLSRTEALKVMKRKKISF